MVYRLRNGLYAHPFEMVACISTFLGVWGAFKLLVHNPEVLDRIEDGILSVPKYILWIWVIVGFFGCVTTALGLAASIFSNKGRVVEAAGLWMMGAMWLSAGVAMIFLDWQAWEQYLRFFSIATACIVRLMMLNDFHSIMSRAPLVGEG
jgi:hypothetical protein